MIRARLVMGDGRDLVILGLSFENMARLSADEPIYVDTAAPATEYGLEVPGGPIVAIVAGKTENDILAKLKAGGIDAEQARTFKRDPRTLSEDPA